MEATDLMAIFTGTHGMANGLDAVLDAGAELKRRGRTDIKLVLVGQGMRKPALRERAAAEGLDGAGGGPLVFMIRLIGTPGRPDGGSGPGHADSGQRPRVLLRHLAE